MQAFQAWVLASNGKRLRMRIWASDATTGAALLRQKGWHPFALKPLRKAGTRQLARLTLPAIDLAAFLDQLSMQLDAEVPIDVALRNMANDMEEGSAHSLAVGLLEAISANGKITEAFSQFPRIFPTHVCQMIEVGHQTGRLPKTFSDVATGVMEAEEIRAAARKALQYPAVAGVITSGVAVFLLGFVLPMFGRVFADLAVPLPKLTAFYISLSAMLVEHRFVAFFVLLAVLVGLRLLLRRRRVREGLECAVARAPVLGGIVQALAVARVTSSLRLLCGAGIPVQDGLRVAAGLTGNTYYNRMLQATLKQVSLGTGVGRAMEETHAFPAMMTLTLRMGEETNRLPQALEKVHSYYSRKARQQIAQGLQWIEPAMTVFLGGFVGSVAVSLFYPLVTLAMSIRH